MGYVGWGLVAEQANTTTGGAQRTVGITSSPGAGIAQSSLNSVNNGGGGVVNNYGAVWDNLFVRQYLFGRGEQGAWFDPSDFQPNWRRNLLTWTEQFDNAAWSKTRATVTANAMAAPDGTVTADKLVANTDANTHFAGQNLSLTSGVTYTLSSRVKAGEYSQVRLSATGTGVWASAIFNLATGTVVSTAAGSGAAIQAAGNGWYVISVQGVADVTGTTTFALAPAVGGTANFTGDGTSGIYIWGAQIEAASTATAYQPITDGIVDYLTYQPQPILYQDSAGVTPVTALEQPCGLMLDKSKGLQLGPELVTNGDFSDGTTGWSAVGGGSISVSGGVATLSSGVSGSITAQQEITTVAGRWYQASVDVISLSAGTQSLIVGTASGGQQLFSSFTSNLGQRKAVFLATGTTTYIGWNCGNVSRSATVDNISIRELSGNHAYQTTSSKRPVVSARVNLLTYTEQFDNVIWTALRTTITANVATAPDGTLTANTLIENTDTNTHYVAYSVTTWPAQQYTVSIFAKQSSGSRRLSISQSFGGNVNHAIFDLSSGALVSTGGTNTASITSVGDGWYKCSVTYTTTNTTARFDFALNESGNTGLQSYTGDGTSGIFIWGADLRPADQATGIMPRYQRVGAATSGTSTSSGVADYDSVGFPVYLRTDGIDDAMLTNSIDFNTVTSDGLPRRNLFVNPTQFDASGWVLSSITVTANATTAPDGTATADKIVEVAASAGHSLYQNVAVTNGTTYTMSCYLKKSERDFGWLKFSDSTTNWGRTFNLATGQVGSVVSGFTAPTTSTITDAGNGWWRCTITMTAGATGTGGQDIGVMATDGTRVYLGDGTSGIFLWGAQLETGSTATAFQNIGTDQVTVFAGVRKLSDAATASVSEFGPNVDTTNGSFALLAPGAATTDVRFRSRGTVLASATATSIVAPITNVYTGISDIAADSVALRINGTQVVSSSGDQGTGNYGNYPLYLFARAGTSLFFTGNFYGLIVRGAQTDTSLITTTEEYIANVTGFGAPVVVGTPSIGVSI